MVRRHCPSSVVVVRYDEPGRRSTTCPTSTAGPVTMLPLRHELLHGLKTCHQACPPRSDARQTFTTLFSLLVVAVCSLYHNDDNRSPDGCATFPSGQPLLLLRWQLNIFNRGLSIGVWRFRHHDHCWCRTPSPPNAFPHKQISRYSEINPFVLRSLCVRIYSLPRHTSTDCTHQHPRSSIPRPPHKIFYRTSAHHTYPSSQVHAREQRI